MQSDIKNDLFEELKSYGFNDLQDISIYEYKSTALNQPTGNASETDPKDSLYDRKLDCPVCQSHIIVRSVKSSSIRVLSRDTDFMIYYNEPNFMFYDAWVCPECGYAALSSQFKSISDRQIKMLKEVIRSKWVPKVYPEIYDVNIAIERYKLALFSAVTKKSKPREKASLCLKIAWLYRIKGDQENEKKFLSNALEGFLLAYDNDTFPINGLDEASFTYLMGELYRRTDDTTNALIWFSKVMANRSSPSRIKDMTRDQKALIVNANYTKTEAENPAPTQQPKTPPPKKGFFELLFNKVK